MKRLVLPAILAVAIPVPALAGDTTAVGIGTGIAKSTSVSSSKAVAISGQGGTGVGVGTGGNPAATVNIAGNPANTVATVNNEGTSTVKNVPAVFAPGLAAAGLETCLGSVSGGGSFVGTGFSFGSTIPDPGCAARLDARTLWSMGLKKAAVARLCLTAEIQRAMPEVCVHYLPQPVAAAYPVALPGGEPTPLIAPAYPGYVGGEIWLVEGATGHDRLCKDYNAVQQRCRVWAHTSGAVPKRRVMHLSHTAVTPAAPAAEPSKEESK
jgi:hypothetical protein